MNIIFTKTDRNSASLQLLKKIKDSGEVIGKVLDSGSRDGALLEKVGELLNTKQLLAIDYHNRVQNGIEFFSHNLETPLPFNDKHFDIIICNDVLEHVENKNQLLVELLRTANQYVIISLPNTQFYIYILGLIKGNKSKQYNFLVEDGVDRHRWITYYDQNIEFIQRNLGSNWSVVGEINTIPNKKLPTGIAKILKKYFVFNQVFMLKRQ
jgi:SAM-dependent methyltransferase